jgi:transketolase
MQTDYRLLSRKIMLDSRSMHLRNLVLDALEGGERGHLGPALSLLEIIRVLYDEVLVHNPLIPDLSERDRFILSKGHGCLGLYVVLADKGYFSVRELQRFCSFNSILGGHPEKDKVPGVEFSTGSLGHGLSVGVGIAMAARLRNEDWRTFVVIGDGELNEGSIWEAALHASNHNLGLLTVIVDFNAMQASGWTKEVVSIEPILDKWKAFGFEAFQCNGHDVHELSKILKIKRNRVGKPKVILAHTIKGKGLKSAENSNYWHHKAKISKDEINILRNEISYP